MTTDAALEGFVMLIEEGTTIAAIRLFDEHGTVVGEITGQSITLWSPREDADLLIHLRVRPTAKEAT